jgi:hypothetical protein
MGALYNQSREALPHSNHTRSGRLRVATARTGALPSGNSARAAALAVLREADLTQRRVVVVTGRRVPHLALDLSVLADTVWIWESDSLYGGEQRLAVLPDSDYVLLDLREVGNLGAATQTFSAILESCPGWPCHQEYRVRVREDSTGFVGHSELISIE